VVIQAKRGVAVLTRACRWAVRTEWSPRARGIRGAAVLAGLAALLVYVLPGLLAPAANWPLWDVRVYWCGGRQAAAGGGTLYAPGARLAVLAAVGVTLAREHGR